MPSRRCRRCPDTTDIADTDDGAVREAAHAYDALRRAPAAGGTAESDHDVSGTGLPVRVYRPIGHEGLTPALVFVHGGGFTLGMIDADDQRCRDDARAAGCVIVSVEYRLAPEHPYPAGVTV